MNEEIKQRYAELLKQRKEAEEQGRAEAEREEQERRRLDELVALQHQSKRGELGAIVKQFGEGPVPPTALADQPQTWPKGIDRQQPHSLFVDEASLTDHQVNQLKKNVEDYYPDHCKLYEYTATNGKRGMIVTGVTAEEAAAIENMIAEKRKLEASLGRTHKEPEQGKGAPAGLEEKIAEAMNPQVAPPAVTTENSPSPTPQQMGQKVKQLF